MPKTSSTTTTNSTDTAKMAAATVITPFQSRVYALLLQIPSGRVTTYGHLARALSTSPRAVGNALRHNPFAFTFSSDSSDSSDCQGGVDDHHHHRDSAVTSVVALVPCHRVVQSTGHIGGFLGEYQKAPSGVNQSRKRELLRREGVVFDDEGMLLLPSKNDQNGNGEKGVKVARTALERAFFDGPWDLTETFEPDESSR